jgi:hypothetical protein
MPLLDHFHPPLHGPRRWEGFHHAWATSIAHELNQDVLPPDYFAEPEISLGPEMEIDVATLQLDGGGSGGRGLKLARWTPPKARMAMPVDYARLDTYEIRVYEDLGGPQLRGCIELVSPANKDRRGHRLTFSAKCAGYLQHGIGVVMVDVVTARSADLHETLLDMLEVKTKRAAWTSPTGLYAVAYRPMTVRKSPRVEIWPEALALGKRLPVMPLWLALDLCVPVRLEDSYAAACQSLRISA